jgi:hypothetical protein
MDKRSFHTVSLSHTVEWQEESAARLCRRKGSGTLVELELLVSVPVQLGEAQKLKTIKCVCPRVLTW